jgi:hypothetical protein
MAAAWGNQSKSANQNFTPACQTYLACHARSIK